MCTFHTQQDGNLSVSSLLYKLENSDSRKLTAHRPSLNESAETQSSKLRPGDSCHPQWTNGYETGHAGLQF